MTRVLETVLTGRNLLSPVLASASKDVVAYNSTVSAAQEKAAATATASASRQQAAAAKVAASNTKASTTASVTADQQVRAYARTGESATASATVQSRAHAKAAESATVSSKVQQSANRALAASNGLLGTSLSPLTAGLGALGLGLGYAAYRGMTFDSAMSEVQAATMATAGTMKQLRDVAIEQGARTKYSSEEAAQGITEMAKAGVSAKDIIGGGLAGALNLAAAGQIAVGDAAEIAATQLTVFKLKGDQVGHVADLLAAGAGKAQGGVSDLALALQYAGLPAKGLGMSIEETTGTLALFASNGLVGEKAGTSFRGMLTSLTNVTPQTQQVMDKLNLSFFDSQGHFIGMNAVADELKTKLHGVSDETRNATLAQIFGNVSLGAAQILYKSGAAGVDEWGKKVSDAGYATRQASINQDNLRGDLEKLGGAFDSTMTTIGQGEQGPLRFLVEMLTNIVNTGGDVIGFFSSLPAPVQATLVSLGAMAALSGPLSGVLGVLRGFGSGLGSSIGGTFTSFGQALGYAKANGEGLGTVLRSVGSYAGGQLKAGLSSVVNFLGGPWGLAITAVVGSYALMRSASDENSAATAAAARVTERATAAQQSYKQALDAANGAINESVRRAAAKALQDEGLLTVGERLGISTSAMTDSLLGNKDAYASILPVLEDYHTKLAIEAAFNGGDKSREKKLAELEAQIAAYKRLVGTQPDVVTGEQQIATAVGESAAQTAEATKALEEWRKQLQQVGTDFVDPLNTYKGLLSEKQQAEQESAQKTADSTKSSKDSWKDYVKDVSVSLDEYATKLEEQLTAQENWRTNLVTVTQRGGLEVGQALAAMGVEGAGITDKMAHATKADFDRMAADLIADAKNGGAGAAANLDNAMKIMAAVAASGGKSTAAQLAKQLGLGVADVAAIAKQYGIKLAEGINPVLVGLGKPVITATQLRIGKDYDVGGYTGPGRKHEYAGAAHKGEVIWSQDDVAAHGGPQRVDALRRARGYAGGGFVTGADVPRPYSTAPFRLPISTPADAGMATEYAATVAYLGAHLFTGGSGGAGSPAIRALGQQIAASMGYGSQFGAIDYVFSHESGWNPQAQNPTSTAYGIPQFLASTWAQYGGKTPYAGQQIHHGIEYMVDRYGSPNNAAAFWQAHHWYDAGGVANGAGYLAKGTVAPERVLSPRQTEAFERWMHVAPAAMPGYGHATGSGSGTVTLAPPNVTVEARVFVGDREITDIVRVESRAVVDGRLEDLYRKKRYQ